MLILHMPSPDQSYTVVFEPAPEGGFVAAVPALPGCFSQGGTFEEARRNVQDAIAAYLSVLKEDGDDIPKESDERIVASVKAPA